MLKRSLLLVLLTTTFLSGLMGTTSAQKRVAPKGKKAMPAVQQRPADPDKAGTIREIFVKVQTDPKVKWTNAIGGFEDKIAAAIARINPTKRTEFSPCDGKRDGTVVVKFVAPRYKEVPGPCMSEYETKCTTHVLDGYDVVAEVFVWDERTGQSSSIGTFNKTVSVACDQNNAGDIAGSGIYKLAQFVNSKQ